MTDKKWILYFYLHLFYKISTCLLTMDDFYIFKYRKFISAIKYPIFSIRFACPTDYNPYFNQKFLPLIPWTLRNVMAYLVDFHSNLKKMTFLSNGNSLNIDFQGTEGLSRNLVSTLLPYFNWSLSKSYLPLWIGSILKMWNSIWQIKSEFSTFTFIYSSKSPHVYLPWMTSTFLNTGSSYLP
jgi:hypothetical protein